MASPITPVKERFGVLPPLEAKGAEAVTTVGVWWAVESAEWAVMSESISADSSRAEACAPSTVSASRPLQDPSFSDVQAVPEILRGDMVPEVISEALVVLV